MYIMNSMKNQIINLASTERIFVQGTDDGWFEIVAYCESGATVVLSRWRTRDGAYDALQDIFCAVLDKAIAYQAYDDPED